MGRIVVWIELCLGGLVLTVVWTELLPKFICVLDCGMGEIFTWTELWSGQNCNSNLTVVFLNSAVEWAKCGVLNSGPDCGLHRIVAEINCSRNEVYNLDRIVFWTGQYCNLDRILIYECNYSLDWSATVVCVDLLSGLNCGLEWIVVGTYFQFELKFDPDGIVVLTDLCDLNLTVIWTEFRLELKENSSMDSISNFEFLILIYPLEICFSQIWFTLESEDDQLKSGRPQQIKIGPAGWLMNDRSKLFRPEIENDASMADFLIGSGDLFFLLFFNAAGPYHTKTYYFHHRRFSFPKDLQNFDGFINFLLFKLVLI